MENRLMTIEEVSDLTGMDHRLLARMRVDGAGPLFVKIGHRTVRYWQADVVAWINARRFSSTAEYGAHA
jgi:predicted DNA-binding transcriptional regulator AlpA